MEKFRIAIGAAEFINGHELPQIKFIHDSFKYGTQPIPVAVRPKAWVLLDCGFESRRRHGFLSFANVACWYVEISAMDRFLIQRSPTECPVPAT